MKLPGDSRGWMWTALVLLLAASCTIKADGNSSLTTAATGTSKAVTSHVNSTSPLIIEKGNSSTTLVPVTSNSSAATSPTSATTPIHNTTHSTATTQGHATTNVSSTTVTSQVTSKTSTVISTSSSPLTSSIAAVLEKTSGFDLGSFIGGIVLTLGFLAAVYFGCRFYNSKRGVRYRTIDEHEAII